MFVGNHFSIEPDCKAYASFRVFSPLAQLISILTEAKSIDIKKIIIKIVPFNVIGETVKKVLSNFIEERYSSHKSGIGAQIMSGKVGLEEIEKWILKQEKPVLQSARQEMLENIINTYIF